MIFISSAIAQATANLIGNKPRFLTLGKAAVAGQKCTAGFFGPQAFIFSALVVTYHMIGRIQNTLGRTIVFLQLNHTGLRIILFKTQNIADIGTTPLINRLVVVPYYTQILIFLCQQFDQYILCHIGILILVHQNIAEPLLITIQHIGIFLK